MTVRPQLDALTGARGIAAWYVVFYHIREAFDDRVPAGLISFFSKGYLAVDLFFVLSGFVMWLNYGDKFERDGLSAAPDFFRRRFARIYPLHFVILSAMLGFVVLLAATGRGDAIRYPLSEVPLHYLLVQNWGFTKLLSWNDPAWSISTEFAAYLALPLVAVGLNRVRNGAIANVSVIIALCTGLALVFSAQGSTRLGDDISGNGVVRCLAEFFIGVGVCRLWQQKQRWFDGIALATAACAASMWATGAAPETVTVPALFAATVYGLAQSSNRPGNPLSSRMFIHLGDISYSTYLVHFFLWTLYKLLFVSDPASVPLISLFGFIAATYLTSELLYRAVEEPGRNWIQASASKPKQARTPLPVAAGD
jgi:peptidoglycan/LPS O-acetylase OafA/YrhL